ncbi:MAG: metallophosphoesterase [Chloroflexi bacterium]|nr:metallophosphoesterase [Chloroflexota bacterium]
MDSNGDVRRPLVIAHSSDLHICFEGRVRQSDVGVLDIVLRTAAANGADMLLLAGDIFDHNRLPLETLDRTTRLLADYGKPVVILPGNHDPVTADSVYRRGGMADPDNVHVFGVTDGEQAAFAGLDLSVWGRPHMDYGDMSPLEGAPGRIYRWQIAMAHGHWHHGDDDPHRSWLIRSHQIAALDADYLALGHWDRPTPAGDGSIAAYYSGSPDLAQTINLVHLEAGGVRVERAPLVERA